MRLAIPALALYFLAVPALAADRAIPITCALIDTQETGRLLGVTLEPPVFDDLMVCVGMCPSHHPLPNCNFALISPRNGGQKDFLTVDLGLRPFEPANWAEIVYVTAKWTRDRSVRFLRWPGGIAVWDFPRGYNWGRIDVFFGPRRNPCAYLKIGLGGETDEAKALKDITLLARHAFARLARATPEELHLPAEDPRFDQLRYCLSKKGA